MVLFKSDDAPSRRLLNRREFPPDALINLASNNRHKKGSTMKYFVRPIVLFIFLAGSEGVFPSDTLAKDVKEYMQKLRDGIVWMSASNDYCGTPSRQLKAVWEDLLNVTTISPERRREIMDGFET